MMHAVRSMAMDAARVEMVRELALIDCKRICNYCARCRDRLIDEPIMGSELIKIRLKNDLIVESTDTDTRNLNFANLFSIPQSKE